MINKKFIIPYLIIVTNLKTVNFILENIEFIITELG